MSGTVLRVERTLALNADEVRALLAGPGTVKRPIDTGGESSLGWNHLGRFDFCRGDHPKHHACEEHSFEVDCPWGELDEPGVVVACTEALDVWPGALCTALDGVPIEVKDWAWFDAFTGASCPAEQAPAWAARIRRPRLNVTVERTDAGWVWAVHLAGPERNVTR